MMKNESKKNIYSGNFCLTVTFYRRLNLLVISECTILYYFAALKGVIIRKIRDRSL